MTKLTYVLIGIDIWACYGLASITIQVLSQGVK